MVPPFWCFRPAFGTLHLDRQPLPKFFHQRNHKRECIWYLMKEGREGGREGKEGGKRKAEERKENREREDRKEEGRERRKEERKEKTF